MKNKFKQIVATMAAVAVALTTVVVTDVATASAAEADYDTLYISESVESAAAGVEQKYNFTVSKAGDLYFTLVVPAPVEYTIAVYNSAGALLDVTNNPMTVTATDQYWQTVQEAYAYDDAWNSLPNGDYTYGITFAADTQYQFMIQQEKASAKISDSKATVTAGFTKKLSVSGAKVTKWSTSKKDIATVDQKGKVTAKKAGKTTISAKLDNGQTVKCVVTVKANKYTDTKATVSDVPYGSCVLHAHSASFDSKGNLVIKARFVNNYYYKVVALNNVKIVVKDGNGKTIGTYSTKKKSLTVQKGSAKDVSFTIAKSKLKKKTADLRNASISCDGEYTYTY
ncbi:Ig-like domain-containing protein [Lachnospiraceae bacterium 47-T17]